MSTDTTERPGWLRFIAAFIGPAAVMAAGIMGAGSTGSLVLAGAWFRYDLLWIAILTLPAVVICLDSGARVGIMSGGKGMLSVIRDEIHPGVTWFVVAVMVLFNIFVNMGQMSVMTASFLSAFGWYPPAAGAADAGSYKMAEVVLTIVFSGGLLAMLLSGGYERAQKIMTGLLFFMFLCFFIVAVRGVQEFGAILGGLIPSIPPDLPVPGTDKVRDSYSSIVAIAGGALAAAPILSFSYFHTDDKATPADMPHYFWNSVLNLGVVFGLYSILVLVAGGFALYPLTDPNHAAIESVNEAGRVLTHALPAGLSALAPKVFAAGLFACGLTTLVVVAQLMCYFCLDAIKRDWHYTKENTAFRWLLVFWVSVPAVLAPLWTFPALLKMILLMGLNIVIVPMAIVIIIYLVNKRAVMGDYKANVWRNVFLAASLALSLWMASEKLPDYVEKIQEQVGENSGLTAQEVEPQMDTNSHE